jgi:hypothetical protein
MPQPKPVSTERELRLKYTKSTVIEALGLNIGQEVATLSVNQYGELLVTLSHGPDAPRDDDLPPRAPRWLFNDDGSGI